MSVPLRFAPGRAVVLRIEPRCACLAPSGFHPRPCGPLTPPAARGLRAPLAPIGGQLALASVHDRRTPAEPARGGAARPPLAHRACCARRAEPPDAAGLGPRPVDKTRTTCNRQARPPLTAQLPRRLGIGGAIPDGDGQRCALAVDQAWTAA